MDRDERYGLKPIARDTHRPVARPRAWPAPLPPDRIPPLLIRDPACPAACSRREALILLAEIALLSTPLAAALADPREDDLQRLAARFASDARLDQKVSPTAWAEPLEDVLSRLSRETGVQLIFDGRDVGDQRVNLLLKDQPLRRVQVLLAETLDLFWLRDRKAPRYRYTLFQDARSRKSEQELLSRAREGFDEGIRRLVDWLKLAPPEIEQLHARGFQQTFWLTQPARRMSIRLLSRLAPAHWEQWMQAGKVKIPYASLSAADQELVRQFVEEWNKLEDQQDQERGTPGKHHIGDVTQPGGEVVMQLFDGSPPGPDSEYSIGVAPAEGRGGGGGVGLGYTPGDRRRLREEFTPPGFEKEKRNPPPDGGPRVTVAWKRKEFLPWEEVLKAMAEGGDLQVVSDSYLYYWWEHNTLLPEASALRDRPLAEVLDQVSEPFFHSWRRDGDVYQFRHRNWFIEKRHNVPERDLRRWRAHLEGGGRLTLADLAELAVLTDRQLSLLYHTPVPTGAVHGHRELLRFYAALNPFQRARLETTGLRLGELTAPQGELLRAWKPGAPGDTDARLGLRREPEAVVFTLATGAPVPQEERVPLERGRPLPTEG